MAISTPVQKMSLKEFLSLPEDGPKYELEYGEIVELTRPTFEHNELLLNLAMILKTHIRANQLGRLRMDILVVLDELTHLAYAPDLIFVATENLAVIQDGCVYGAPDLVVEILSPSTANRDHFTKFKAYHKTGVPWYWIIDPSGPGIEEHHHTPDGYLRTATVECDARFHPGLFPDLTIDLNTLTT